MKRLYIFFSFILRTHNIHKDRWARFLWWSIFGIVYLFTLKKMDLSSKGFNIEQQLKRVLNDSYNDFQANLIFKNKPAKLKDGSYFIRGARTKSADELHRSAYLLHGTGELYLAFYEAKKQAVMYCTNQLSEAQNLPPCLLLWYRSYFPNTPLIAQNGDPINLVAQHGFDEELVKKLGL